MWIAHAFNHDSSKIIIICNSLSNTHDLKLDFSYHLPIQTNPMEMI